MVEPRSHRMVEPRSQRPAATRRIEPGTVAPAGPREPGEGSPARGRGEREPISSTISRRWPCVVRCMALSSSPWRRIVPSISTRSVIVKRIFVPRWIGRRLSAIAMGVSARARGAEQDDVLGPRSMNRRSAREQRRQSRRTPGSAFGAPRRRSRRPAPDPDPGSGSSIVSIAGTPGLVGAPVWEVMAMDRGRSSHGHREESSGDAEVGLAAPEAFGAARGARVRGRRPWAERHPAIAQSRRRHRDRVVPFPAASFARSFAPPTPPARRTPSGAAPRARGLLSSEEAAIERLPLVPNRATGDRKRLPRERLEAETPLAVVVSRTLQGPPNATGLAQREPRGSPLSACRPPTGGRPGSPTPLRLHEAFRRRLETPERFLSETAPTPFRARLASERITMRKLTDGRSSPRPSPIDLAA